MKTIYLIAALLFVAVPVEAQDKAGIIEWWSPIHYAKEIADWDVGLGWQVDINITTPHNYTILNRLERLQIDFNVVMETPSNSIALRTFNINWANTSGTELLNYCVTNIQATGQSGGPGTSFPASETIYGRMSCPPITANTNLTLANGTEQTLFFGTQGSGTIKAVRAAVYLEVQDTVTIPPGGSSMSHENHILETIETLSPFILGFILVFMARKEMYPVAIIGFLLVAFGSLAYGIANIWSGLAAIQIFLIGFLLVVVARIGFVALDTWSDEA